MDKVDMKDLLNGKIVQLRDVVDDLDAFRALGDKKKNEPIVPVPIGELVAEIDAAVEKAKKELADNLNFLNNEVNKIVGDLSTISVKTNGGDNGF